MSHARTTRSSLPSHRLVVLVALLAVAGALGCQRVPLRYQDAAPTPETKPTTRPDAPAPAASTASADLPALPIESRADNQPLTRLASTQTPTPLLDAAVARAEERPHAIDDEPSEELVDLQPVPQPAKPAGRPATAPAATPKVDPQVTPARIPTGPGSELAAADPAAPKPVDIKGAPSPPPKPPADPWKDGLDRLRELARTRSGQPGDEAPTWSVRARTLDTLQLQGPVSKPAQLELWESLLGVLTAASATESPDEAVVAAGVRKAVDALEGLAPLRISDLQVCRKVLGFGHYETIDPTALKAGQPLIVYCEMAGLRYNADDHGYRSRLASRVELVARKADRPVWMQDLGTAEDVCRRRRRDYYVNYRLTLPATLHPGPYDLRLTQTDLNGDQSVTSSLPLEVRP